MIPIVRPAQLPGAQPARRAPRPALRAKRSICGRIGDVGVEGGLDRLRLGLAHERDRALVLERRPPRAARRRRGARSASVSSASGREPQLGEGADSQPRQPLDRLRADAGDQTRGRSGKALQRLLAAEANQPGRLGQLAGDLGQQLALGDPDRAGEPGLLADLARDPPHHRLRARRAPSGRGRPRPARPPRPVSALRAEDLHHLPRSLAVGAKSGWRRSRPAAAGGQPPRASPNGSRPACGPRSWRSSPPPAVPIRRRPPACRAAPGAAAAPPRHRRRPCRGGR